MSDLRTDIPALERDLAVAVRFVDIFTLQPVRTSLAVSIPSLNWTAYPAADDGTYVFSLSNVPLSNGVPQLPTGSFNLSVVLPGITNPPANSSTALQRGPYAMFEQQVVKLPPYAVAPVAPLTSVDFISQFNLWPTVAFRVPAGETSVWAQIKSNSNQSVAGFKVLLFDPSNPPPTTPYARTDAAGQFLYRFPTLKRGTTAAPSTTLNVQAFDPANNSVTVQPASLNILIGQQNSGVVLTIP